jgi:hypothetical protein
MFVYYGMFVCFLLTLVLVKYYFCCEFHVARMFVFQHYHQSAVIGFLHWHNTGAETRSHIWPVMCSRGVEGQYFDLNFLLKQVLQPCKDLT